MDGERSAPTRRKRIDGTILFGGVLSALLHAVGVALLLTTPTRVQPLEQMAYTVEVVDPDALGGELLAGPIGAAAPAGRDEPEPEPVPPEPKPEPEEPVRIAQAEPPEPEPDAAPIEKAPPTPRATPAAQATARPKPKPTLTKIVKVAAVPKRTPVRHPAAKKTAAPAPKRVPAVKKTAVPTRVAAAKKPTTAGAAPGDAGGPGDRGADPDLDSRLSAAIAGLAGKGAPGSGSGGTADTQTGSPGVGGEGPGGGGQVRGLKFVAYYTQMLARIKGRWTWLGGRSDLRVTVRFSILPSGDIANLRLVERSGDATYDASVQRAIKGASPFAPPPEAYQRDFADVELTFRPADLEVSG